MNFDDIVPHSIVHVRLTGERVFVVNKGIDGTEPWVSARRCQHTHENGDVYVTESWHPDELQSEADHEKEHEKGRGDLLEALRSHGVMILNDAPLPKDPNAN